jgi:hypothetical protein
MKRPAGFIAVNVVAMLWAALAFAGPPLITDDPDTPGPNHWEINDAITSQYANHTWQLQTPLLDNNYGVGDHIELTYEVSWNEVAPDHGGVLSGLGDSLFGVKWRFLDQDKNWLDVSVYPQVQVNNPTSSVRRGIVADGTSVIVPFEIGHRAGPLDFYMEPGYTWNQRGAAQGFGGLAAEYDLSEKFTLMGELHYDFENAFHENELLFNLGFQQTLTRHINLLGSAGSAVFGPASVRPNFMSYLALQFLY